MPGIYQMGNMMTAHHGDSLFSQLWCQWWSKAQDEGDGHDEVSSWTLVWIDGSRGLGHISHFLMKWAHPEYILCGQHCNKYWVMDTRMGHFSF